MAGAMKPSKLPPAMFERALTLDVRGKTRKVMVRVHKPKRDVLPGGDWQCDFTISGIPGRRPVTRSSYGVDSMQAALLALQHLRLELRYYQAERVDLRWLGTKALHFPKISAGEPSVEEYRRTRKPDRRPRAR